MSLWKQFKEKMPITKNVLKFTLCTTIGASLGFGVFVGVPLAIAGAAAGAVPGALAGAATGVLTSAVMGVNMLSGIVFPATLIAGIGETVYKTVKEEGQAAHAQKAGPKVSHPKYANTQSQKGPSLSLNNKGGASNAFGKAGHTSENQSETPKQTPAANQNNHLSIKKRK